MAGRHALIEAIEREGERRKEEILRKGREEAETLLRRVREEIGFRETKGLEDLKTELTRFRTRERNRAILEAGRRRARVEERVLQDLFLWVRENLPGLRMDPSYPEALRKMWEEGLAAAGIGRQARRAGEVEPTPGVLRLHPDDVRILREEADRSGWRIISDPGIHGGLRIDLRGGKIVLSNTLESRLEKGWREWLPEIRTILLD